MRDILGHLECILIVWQYIKAVNASNTNILTLINRYGQIRNQRNDSKSNSRSKSYGNRGNHNPNDKIVGTVMKQMKTQNKLTEKEKNVIYVLGEVIWDVGFFDVVDMNMICIHFTFTLCIQIKNF